MSFLRNPLAWHKRYVEGVYDMPSGPAAVIGRAGHKALEHFYNGVEKDESIRLGLGYLQSVSDFEINFGKATSARAIKEKKKKMEKEYLQAVNFYLARPPRHKVLGVEVINTVHVPGLPLPIKAVSDLVVESRVQKGAVDIVDHKFVDSFSSLGNDKPLFVLQAIFNYYTVRDLYDMPVKRFILQECKKKKNRDGKSQMKRHIIVYEDHADDFALFHRLIKDATKEIGRKQVFLPNPTDMFEGKNSFEIYRMELVDEQ